MQARMQSPLEDDRLFCLFVSLLLAIIGGILWLIFGHFVRWPFYGIVALVIIGILKPHIVFPLRLAFGALGARLGVLNTHLVLALFFWVILTPVALLLRVSGRDILRLRRQDATTSYLMPVDDRVSTANLIDPF